jgi:hypothetical protein
LTVFKDWKGTMLRRAAEPSTSSLPSCRCWGVDPKANQRSAGEIDVTFSAGDIRYILEAKWEKTKTNTGQLAKLQKRVRQRLSGTYGIFLSMAGYSEEALREISQGERLEVLLLDFRHLAAMLDGMVSPQQLLSRLRDVAAFEGAAYTPMSKLVPGTSPSTNSAATTVPPDADVLTPFGKDLRSDSGELLPWNPVRADRGNPKGAYVAFVGRQGLYALLTLLLGFLILLLLFLLFIVGWFGKVLLALAVVVCILLAWGFGLMAAVPVRLEIGLFGMQVHARRETVWIPWEVVDRVDVIRVEGNPHVVAWCERADLFPELDTFGGGPRFLPALGAIAVCPLARSPSQTS